MKKQRFFTIKTGEYSSSVLYFKDLKGAMKIFELLIEGEATEIGNESVSPVKKAKKGEYLSDDYFDYIKDKPEYHLSSEIKDIYTKEEIEKIKKGRKVKMKALK